MCVCACVHVSDLAIKSNYLTIAALLSAALEPPISPTFLMVLLSTALLAAAGLFCLTRADLSSLLPPTFRPRAFPPPRSTSLSPDRTPILASALRAFFFLQRPIQKDVREIQAHPTAGIGARGRAREGERDRVDVREI